MGKIVTLCDLFACSEFSNQIEVYHSNYDEKIVLSERFAMSLNSITSKKGIEEKIRSCCDDDPQFSTLLEWLDKRISFIQAIPMREEDRMQQFPYAFDSVLRITVWEG